MKRKVPIQDKKESETDINPKRQKCTVSFFLSLLTVGWLVNEVVDWLEENKKLLHSCQAPLIKVCKTLGPQYASNYVSHYVLSASTETKSTKQYQNIVKELRDSIPLTSSSTTFATTIKSQSLMEKEHANEMEKQKQYYLKEIEKLKKQQEQENEKLKKQQEQELEKHSSSTRTCRKRTKAPRRIK